MFVLCSARLGLLTEVHQVAYSTDGGYTFTKYVNNPVISINSTQFRDPKVIWYPLTQQWVMVVAYAQEFTIGCAFASQKSGSDSQIILSDTSITVSLHPRT